MDIDEEKADNVRELWKQQFTLGEDITPTMQTIVSSLVTASGETIERDFRTRMYEAYKDVPEQQIRNPLARQILREYTSDKNAATSEHDKRALLRKAEEMKARATFPEGIDNTSTAEDNKNTNFSADEHLKHTANNDQRTVDNNDNNNEEDSIKNMTGPASEKEVEDVSATPTEASGKTRRKRKRDKTPTSRK